MLNIRLKRFYTKEFAVRFAIVLLIAISYLFLIRPGRAWLSQEWVRPMAEKYAEQQPDKLMLSGSSSSVSFTVYIISEDPNRTDHEVTFGFPFGFFLVIPLMFLILIDFTNRYSYAHLIIQGILGVLMLLFFFSGLTLHTGFLLLYNFTIDYMIPGAAFLIVLFSLIRDNKLTG